MEFADFWNPHEPPDDDGGDGGGGDNNPPTPPTPSQPSEGVQGGSENSALSNCTLDKPEQREIKGVQGGSTVQPGDLAREKSTVAVLEKMETEISSTAIKGGGQTLDTRDKKPEPAIKEPPRKTGPKFKAHIGLKWSEPISGDETDYSTFPHRRSDNLRAKIKQAFRIKEQLLAATNSFELATVSKEHGENQVSWVWRNLLTEAEQNKVRATAQTFQLSLLTPINNEEESQKPPTDPWLEEEALRAMARDLDSCPDRETLASLRLCWPPYAMNAACKLLEPGKYAQVRQWVLELNNHPL